MINIKYIVIIFVVQIIKTKTNMKKPTIQKLLYIPTELYDPLLILAAKTSKGNLNACIVNCIKMALGEKTDTVG